MRIAGSLFIKRLLWNIDISGFYNGTRMSKHLGMDFVTFYSFEAEKIENNEAVTYEYRDLNIMIFANEALTVLFAQAQDGRIQYIAPLYKQFGYDAELIIFNIVAEEAFKRYCKLEVKTLPPNAKAADISCSYLNKTKGTVKILDSKWFTTLVKSDSFNVRGHFRFQPCGEGMKDRKLIWINEFQKDGYTAPAGRLNESS